jgi:hypothetical protein
MVERIGSGGNLVQRELDRCCIREEDFLDVYGVDGLMKIQKEKEEAQKRFSEKINQDAAETMEYVMFRRMELQDWFGDFEEPLTEDEETERPMLTTLLASESDDVLGRTDVILVLNNRFMSGQIISLDATTSRDLEVIDEKFRLAHCMQLPIGYEKLRFVDAEGEAGVRGAMDRVPHVVIGAEPALTEELADLELRRQNGRITDAEKDRMGVLDAKMAYIVTSEIAMQIEAILGVEGGEKEKKVVEYFRQARSKAESRLRNMGERVNDQVFDLIEMFVQERLIRPNSERRVGTQTLAAYEGKKSA